MVSDIKSLQPTISLAPGNSNVSLTGVPTGGKASLVPEIRDKSLIRLIEARGSRIAWTRAAMCPCRLNEETEQSNPRCVRCRGTGHFYFGVPGYTVPDAAGELSTIQTAILADDNASIIRGTFSKPERFDSQYTSMGDWVSGTMSISVRPENRIGYYDRLVNLDAVIAFTEIIDLRNVTTDNMRLRFRAVGLNSVASSTANFEIGTDIILEDNGTVTWTIARPSERIAFHYLMHPSWLVVNHPHAFRTTQRLRKVANPATPLGEPTDLPMQVMVRLEFLLDELRSE